MSIKFLLFVLLSLGAASVAAQTGLLRESIERVIVGKNATVGVAVCGIECNDTLCINGDARFPMQSVLKFYIALAVLGEVDKGTLRLDQKIAISKNDLLPGTWSPIREKYPDGNIELTVAELLKYTVAESDNNGCDILLRLIGGTKTVDDYIHVHGISGIAIRTNEAEMHEGWDIQFKNWTTPLAALSLLADFYSQKIVSQESTGFLWKIMAETATGKNRIRVLLPEGTIVSHKTGTSDTNAEGVTAAVNDVGIVVLPNGRHFAISVFVSNSKKNNATNEKIIADISKAAWDYFTHIVF